MTTIMIDSTFAQCWNFWLTFNCSRFRACLLTSHIQLYLLLFISLYWLGLLHLKIMSTYNTSLRQPTLKLLRTCIASLYEAGCVFYIMSPGMPRHLFENFGQRVRCARKIQYLIAKNTFCTSFFFRGCILTHAFWKSFFKKHRIQVQFWCQF